MDEIREFLSKPYPWFFAVGAGAALGVWFAKMTPVMINVTLATAVVGFTGAVFFFPWVGAQPILIRAIWSIATCSSLSLAAYYTFWTTVVPLTFWATTSGAEQPAGTTIGGVAWLPQYTDVRFSIWNKSRTDYRDIDFVVRTDQALTAAGQITDISGVSIYFHVVPKITPEVVTPDGQRTAMPLAILASSRGYRIRCDVLPGRSHIEIVLAAVTFQSSKEMKEMGVFGQDYWMRHSYTVVETGDNVSFWFAYPGHSDRIFGPKPTVTSVELTGQYMAGEQRVRVQETLPVTDTIGARLPKTPQP